MNTNDFKELSDRIQKLGTTVNIYKFLTEHGVYVQAFSTFSRKVREGYMRKGYGDDLIYMYLPEDEDQQRLLKALREEK